MMDREAIFQMEERGTTLGNGKAATYVGSSATMSTAYAADSCTSLFVGDCNAKWASAESVYALLPKNMQQRNAVFQGITCDARCTGTADRWYGYGRCVCTRVPPPAS